MKNAEGEYAWNIWENESKGKKLDQNNETCNESPNGSIIIMIHK